MASSPDALIQRAMSNIMAHVFISYVRQDQQRVDAVVRELRAAGIEVWLDRTSIKPGQRWQKAIAEAIREGAYFIACFSRASESRAKTYMREELNVALDDLRQRPADRAWFIPVRLDEVEVPDLPISKRESIGDLQWVDLHEDWSGGIGLLISGIQPEIPASVILEAVSRDWQLDSLLKESFDDESQQSPTVLPVLGMHLCRNLAAAVRLAAQNALNATKQSLDVTEFDDISSVIDSLSGTSDFHMHVRETLRSITLDSCPIYRTIAALPAPAFLNATFDDLLTSALTEAGKTPRTYRAAWRTLGESLEGLVPRPRSRKGDGFWVPPPTIRKDDPPEPFPSPSRSSPVVIPLFGHVSDRQPIRFAERDLSILTHLAGAELHDFLSHNYLLLLGFHSQDRALSELLRLLPGPKQIIQLSPVDELRFFISRMISKHNRGEVIERARRQFRELERRFTASGCLVWWESVEVVVAELVAAANRSG